jgi:hypothetical protein
MGDTVGLISQFLMGVTTSVIGTVVIWLLSRTNRVVRKLGIYKLAAWTVVIILPLIPLTVLLPTMLFPEGIKVYLIVFLSCFTLFLLIIMLRDETSSHPCGIDMSTEKKRFDSATDPKGGRPFIYKIPLKQSNEKVEINWATFVKGIHILKENMQRAAIDPDIVFGINETGIMISSYLSFNNRRPLGVIKTRHTKIIQFDCPKPIINKNESDPVLYVLLVDSELKSGQSAMKFQKMITEHYQNEGFKPRITYVVLGGVLKEGQEVGGILKSSDFGWDINESKDKPAFVTFYFDLPGFEPPEGLK